MSMRVYVRLLPHSHTQTPTTKKILFISFSTFFLFPSCAHRDLIRLNYVNKKEEDEKVKRQKEQREKM